jgi:hypothetical protein
MSLHCGLHALNAVLRATGRPPYAAARLDHLTRILHAREVSLCPDGRDVAPDPRGNYPLETLLLALKRRGLRPEFVRSPAADPRPVDHRRTVGYLVGTGDHYTAVVRDARRTGWEWWDNGVLASVWPDDGASPLVRLPAPTVGSSSYTAIRVLWVA